MPIVENFRNLEGEDWLPISGHQTRYLVSNYGRLQSIIPFGNCRRGGIFILSQYSKGRYKTCVLVDELSKKTHLVHRLVAAAFLPNPDNLPQVNHKDTDKHNNHVSNLEWCSKEHNEKHAMENGLKLKMKGSLNGHSKLNETQVLEIRHRWENGEKISALAKEFNMKYISIYDIVHRTNWKHI